MSGTVHIQLPHWCTLNTTGCSLPRICNIVGLRSFVPALHPLTLTPPPRRHCTPGSMYSCAVHYFADIGLEPKNVEPEPVRTDCVAIEHRLSLFLMLFCSHWQKGGRSFDSPRTLLHSRWSAHFDDWNNYGEQRPFGDADSCSSGSDYTACYWRWKWPCCLQKSARLVPVRSQTTIHILAPQQHVQDLITDKHQQMYFFIQHYISLECWFH